MRRLSGDIAEKRQTSRAPGGIILLGAPGAGKGTQAVTLARRLGARHISTGDIFRAHVDRGTELGRAAQGYLDAGRYVPDEVTNAMLRATIVDSAPAGGFVLDGYPRTTAQVGFLDDLLAELDLPPALVVALSVRPDELIRRLVRRSRDSGRSDDTEDVIRGRQAVYLTETTPLLTIYRERGVLREVDGTGRESAVGKRVDSALAALAARPDPVVQ
ncbi:adenylate kinase [Actinoplanes sp. L3-i22]|nr:adenylate kinase [Actinoplanes sp. L3-i22]